MNIKINPQKCFQSQLIIKKNILYFSIGKFRALPYILFIIYSVVEIMLTITECLIFEVNFLFLSDICIIKFII